MAGFQVSLADEIGLPRSSYSTAGLDDGTGLHDLPLNRFHDLERLGTCSLGICAGGAG
jgi:hypothetical protein